MQISIQSNIDDVIKSMNDVAKRQLPAAAQWGLNGTAKKVKAAEQREIRKVFDKPTRYTQNSLWIKWAKKTKLEAIVKLKDEAFKGTPATKYLSAQLTGGRRKHKGFENLLISRGQMPSNMYAVPSRTMRLNQYGNVSNGVIQKILSGLGAQRDKYQRASKGSRTSGKYFSGIIGNVHGIWDITKLQRGQLALMFLFVKSPSYKKRYDFEAVANKTIKTVFRREFDKALKKALETAR